MKSYKAEELFDKSGRLIPELAGLAPEGGRRWDVTRMPMEVFFLKN